MDTYLIIELEEKKLTQNLTPEEEAALQEQYDIIKDITFFETDTYGDMHQ